MRAVSMKAQERWFKACGGVEWHGKEFFARRYGERVSPYDEWDDDTALGQETVVHYHRET